MYHSLWTKGQALTIRVRPLQLNCNDSIWSQFLYLSIYIDPLFICIFKIDLMLLWTIITSCGICKRGCPCHAANSPCLGFGWSLKLGPGCQRYQRYQQLPSLNPLRSSGAFGEFQSSPETTPLGIFNLDYWLSCWHHHNSVKNSVLRPGSACVWSAASHDCSNSPVITPENIYSSFPKIRIIKLMFNWCLDRNGSMMLGKYMQNICKDLGCIPVSWKPRCCYGPGMDSMDSPFGMEHITRPRRARNWLCNPTLGYSKRETHGIRQNWGKQWRLVYQELQDVVQNFPSQTNSMMSGTTTDGATCNKM